MKKNNQRGFTMAEMLIVVAIIGVLAGVSFIAVQNHQRSMAQSERDTIAKEIYFAAQNHLTMAESQGYLTGTVDGGITTAFYGAEETATDSAKTGVTVNANTGKIYYAVVNGGTSFANTSILDLMLPFGSIDETVRGGGNYIIRYQANPAIVLDVFYCSKSGQPDKFNHTIAESEYSTFLGYRYNVPSSGYVVGWYGGAGIGEAGSYLKTPSVEVTNAEKLTVKVTDLNKGDANASIKLVVKSLTSDAKAAFILNGANRDDRVSENTIGVPSDRSEYVITLDDITMHNTVGKGWHFADLNETSLRSQYVDVTGTFKPGENIVVEAVSYSNSSLTNIAYSNEITTNSLYADLIEVAEETTKDENTGVETIVTPKSVTAVINNIRHLENLDKSLSGWDVELTDAKQVVDLDWSDFVSKIGLGTVSVCKKGDTTKGAKTDCYLPVSNTSALTYDGNNLKITNIVVDTTAAASNPSEEPTTSTMITIEAGGVFGALTGGEVKNLELVDTSVTLITGNAGALAGTLSGTTITNVIARNSTDATNVNVSSTSGSVGGLIGTIAGTTSVSKSAAALVVESENGDAGGLIGTSTSTGIIESSYSGGHTHDGTYYKVDDAGEKTEDYNVTATANAGGLIGSAGSTTITNCYSTCSVTGATAGGFVGKAGGTLSGSYCTGLVGGTNKGAFAGELASTGRTSGCSYFEIINEQLDNTGYPYLWALGNAPTDETSVAKIDESANSYNTFVGAPANWREAEVYDDNGRNYYTVQKTKADGTTEPVKMYYLGTNVYNGGINVTSTGSTPVDFVATHYGDWPAPEIFVINTAS